MTTATKARKIPNLKLGNGTQISFANMFDGRVIASVWEPSTLLARTGGHSTITFFEEEPKGAQLYGKIGSRMIPAHVEAMRGGSPERIAACEEWRATQTAEVIAAFKAAKLEGEFDAMMSELEVRTGEVQS